MSLDFSALTDGTQSHPPVVVAMAGGLSQLELERLRKRLAANGSRCQPGGLAMEQGGRHPLEGGGGK